MKLNEITNKKCINRIKHIKVIETMNVEKIKLKKLKLKPRLYTLSPFQNDKTTNSKTQQ